MVCIPKEAQSPAFCIHPRLWAPPTRKVFGLPSFPGQTCTLPRDNESVRLETWAPFLWETDAFQCQNGSVYPNPTGPFLRLTGPCPLGERVRLSAETGPLTSGNGLVFLWKRVRFSVATGPFFCTNGSVFLRQRARFSGETGPFSCGNGPVSL